MVASQPIPVRPRVIIPGEGVCLLVDEVAARLQRGVTGIIGLMGASGSGRSTALAYLGREFLGEPRLRLVDGAAMHCEAEGSLVVCTSAVYERPREIWKLAPWTRDDCIEYLLAKHPKRCRFVVARLDEGSLRLGGSPELWSAVLDQLARDESLPGIREALRAELLDRLICHEGFDAASAGSAIVTCRPELELAQLDAWCKNPHIGEAATRWLCHEPVRLLAAADEILRFLRSGEASRSKGTSQEIVSVPYALIRETAELLRDDAAVLDDLRAILTHGPRWRLAEAVSLLHAASQECRPRGKKTPLLNGAFLSGVDWGGARLAYGALREVDFRRADLHEADLRHASADRADFTHANLNGARLTELSAVEARLATADLRFARAGRAVFTRADLRRTRLDGGLLRNAVFASADLREASLVRANLIGAYFSAARIEGADFTAADLSAARLSGLTLRIADFSGAQFDDAQLEECDLEGMVLPGASFLGANLQNALLTGTRIPEGKFRDADLRGAGLADIEWERADLRDADLRNCTFHLGSSRSGLVGSPLASEGTRTGFYTDELHEQDFKAPEEIRKANLRGADLRGADVEHTDFYLVDLRAARYTREQEDHFRRTGAILETRV